MTAKMPDKPWLEKFEQLDIHAAAGQLVNSGVLTIWHHRGPTPPAAFVSLPLPRSRI